MSIVSQIVHEHIDYAEQIFKMAKTDLVRTYRASALGWLWAIIKPVVTIFIYWFAMSIGLRSGRAHGDYPYFLWLVSGLVPWFYMSDMLNRGTECMRKYRYLITKIHYPVSTIPTFVSVSNMGVQMILLLVVYIIFCVMGFFPGLYTLQIFFYILMDFLFFTAWSLFSAPIAALSQDFLNLVKSFVFALLWVSGIFYDVDSLHNKWIVWILRANPITYIATGFRESFMRQDWFWEHPVRLAVFLAELILLMALACWSFKKLRKEMPDVL